MGVVLDLTARTVSFITLIQDTIDQAAIKSCTRKDIMIPLLNVPIFHVLNELRNKAQGNKVYQQRAIELVWVCDRKPDGITAVDLLLERAAGLMKWLQNREDVLKTKLRHYISLVDVSDYNKSVLVDYTSIHHFSPAPHQWRETVRSVLYATPQDRVELAQAIHYLPMLVVLALGGDKYNPKQQRLLQEWRLPNERAIRLFTRNELYLFNEWRQSNTDLKAEDLLLSDEKLFNSLLAKKIPLPFEVIFNAELKEIEESRRKRYELENHNQTQSNNYPDDPLRHAEAMKLYALALSGGGIRSATFNLGILQGLAKAELLTKFDYLSAVSGGGYIGSWLAAWIKRERSIYNVIDRLNFDKSMDPRGEEVRPIRWLRMYSNYLTPNAGIMSIDSWTMGMTWLRNTLLNLMIILLLFCSILTGGYTLFSVWRHEVVWYVDVTFPNVLLASFALLLPGALLAGLAMHSFHKSDFLLSPVKTKKTSFLAGLLLFLSLVAAYLVSGWLFAGGIIETEFEGKIKLLFTAAIVGMGCLLLVALIGRYDTCMPATKSNWRKARLLFIILVASGIAALSGLVLLAMIWEIIENIGLYSNDSKANLSRAEPSQDKRLSIDLFYKNFEAYFLPKAFMGKIAFSLGIPLVMEVLSLTVVIRMALLGNLFPDERREWWGRVGGMAHRIAFLWLLLSGAVFIGEELLVMAADKFEIGYVTIGGWAVLVGAAVKVAFSAKTPAGGGPLNPRHYWLDMLVRIAPYAFVIGLLILASKLTYRLLHFLFTSDFSWFKQFGTNLNPLYSDWRILLTCTIILAAVSYLLAWRVGVNEFSMHHFYRNRLVRAYLGASRRYSHREQTANQFTGFDKEDDIKLSKLLVKDGYHGPYPILNATLNATRVTDLDRQDRKAESFVFTPLFCGFDIARTRASGGSIRRFYEYGYRPTKGYAYPKGPTLGTAMAISGAAVNPNQGHHSSSATALLLTAFNVRLGWWMGNPRRDTWESADPHFGLAYVFSELMGRSSTQDQYVCLTDGGHFDNMGLYELIRRRCRLIVLSDSEQDAELSCDGLANTIRRCRIDFGVEVNIDLTQIVKRDPVTNFSPEHYAIGTICYPGDPKNRPSGTLVYLKSSLTGNEPADVREYSLSNPAFPHQSTGDQFFDESQFESYRRLGLHIIETAL
ncbi:hypothetical protein OB13_12425, partial [Pontibacter sp. HJ8]